MRKNCSKNNRASGLSVVAAAFISSLLLSLLCSLFFNFWSYELERIALEEGSWQGRVAGAFDENTVSAIEALANVERAEINENLSEDGETVIDIYFHNLRTIYRDMPSIAEVLEIPDSAVSYHEPLLSMYLIHDPMDPEPPLLMMFYLAVLILVSFSLILIIHNSFAVSMNAKVRQLGIFSSIGATPRQIRALLLREAAALCALPLLLGSLAGIALCFGAVELINTLAAGIAGRHEAVFSYHPLIFAVTILAAVLTVFISAWLPARKLGKLTPLAAIRSGEELQLKRKRRSRILSALFGIEGELAGNALKAQKKALRTSTLSLTLSFLGFTLMLCFFTLSGISTDHTYFERYQDAWDVMVTVKDTDIADFTLGEDIAGLNGVASSVVYQKANALCLIPKSGISGEVNGLGGLEALAGTYIASAEDFYSVPSQIIVMDDSSFEDYCEESGIEPDMTGGIVLNRIWDSVNSNFRYKEYIPYLSEELSSVALQNSAAIPILGFTMEPPLLREEYENYALIQFIPLSLWNSISGAVRGSETDTYIRILAEDGASLPDLNILEEELSKTMGEAYSFELENRLQERLDNDAMLEGYMLVLGALCVLLAVIGLANVFSNTLGFIQQRKREFARYMSLGMTPEGMRKMFCIEALVIAGRPILITLPAAILFVGFMITASYLNPMEFLADAPIVPIVIFILAIFGFVALAYYMGGKKILRCDLVEVLRNDGMA